MAADAFTFKYDVAFSLLDRHLDTAQDMASLLEGRLDEFLYSEKQLDLAAKDGVDEFTSVFRRDARVVVAIVGNDWGSTKWTRIEETAIKNRGFDEGYDFLVVIPIDGPGSVPDWVPSTHIWTDLDRLGAAGAAAVIERKIADRGKAARPETAVDVEARLAKQQAEELERQRFLRSEDGVKAADAEFNIILELLAQRRDTMKLHVDVGSQGTTVTRETRSLTVTWSRRYGNTLDESRLRVTLWDGIRSTHVDHDFRARAASSDLTLHLDRHQGQILWREAGRGRRVFSSEELVEHALKTLVRADYGEKASL